MNCESTGRSMTFCRKPELGSCEIVIAVPMQMNSKLLHLKEQS